MLIFYQTSCKRYLSFCNHKLCILSLPSLILPIKRRSVASCFPDLNNIGSTVLRVVYFKNTSVVIFVLDYFITVHQFVFWCKISHSCPYASRFSRKPKSLKLSPVITIKFFQFLLYISRQTHNVILL